MTPPPLPPAVVARLSWAVGVLHDWNTWITQARAMERVANQPGRYEFDLRYTDVGAAHRAQLAQAEAVLAQLETAAAEHEMTREALYAPVGGKPAVLGEAAAVAGWR
jgi:hypothetical protein